MFTKVGQLIQQAPEQIKLPVDLLAGLTSIMAYMEVVTGTAAMVGAVASAAWALYRLYNEHQVAKKNKRK